MLWILDFGIWILDFGFETQSSVGTGVFPAENVGPLIWERYGGSGWMAVGVTRPTQNCSPEAFKVLNRLSSAD
jgi:hypothetical protein